MCQSYENKLFFSHSLFLSSFRLNILTYKYELLSSRGVIFEKHVPYFTTSGSPRPLHLSPPRLFFLRPLLSAKWRSKVARYISAQQTLLDGRSSEVEKISTVRHRGTDDPPVDRSIEIAKGAQCLRYPVEEIHVSVGRQLA